MKIEFVLFQNMLEAKDKDEQIGILMDNGRVLCLCCYGEFEEEDYKIISRQTVVFTNLAEMLRYLHEKKYETIFADGTEGQPRIVLGDILTSVENPEKQMVIVCHQVNCKGVMGAGLAKQVKTKFPGVCDVYKEKCNAFGSENLGSVQLCSCLDEAGYIIANVFAQVGYGKTGLHTDYKALRDAFSRLREFDNTVIRIPYKMGCGVGGGDWKTVKQIIYDELVNYGCKVEIWKQEEL